MRVGYARVSTAEQNEALQMDALTKAGCERIFVDHASGAKTDREGLEQATAFLRSGDTLVVWKLDRAGRSLPHLIELLNTTQQLGGDFISLTEQIDTSTPSGKLLFHVMAALAEFERDLIRERTNAGLAAARARGRKGGRPRKLKSDSKVELSRQLYHENKIPIEGICETLGISKSTLYRYVDLGMEAK